jgi:SAM-dependent methyltransferase
MTQTSGDKVFAGSIPEIYDSHLVPLIFEPFAVDLVTRLARLAPRKVLEIAAGTGVVTRAMAAMLPHETAITATDLNQPMLDTAAALGTKRPVLWQQADAMTLPFEDESFDAVVCQFGVMFFPDKPKAFAQVRRVLRRGGTFLFNAWDRIEENEFADAVTCGLAKLFPEDPPRFLARIPHGYSDRIEIGLDLAGGGFSRPDIRTVEALSKAPSPRIPAIAYCQGTPLRNEIEARGRPLAEATDAATHAMAGRFGTGAVEGKIQAHVIVTGK